jgi:hypothetical protein
MTFEIDIQDLDCIYLSYDEPQKEEFWVKIKNMVPWARRVDGVKGSDAAHKAAAEESDTERFILIDGDNIPDPSFFDLTLDYTNKDESYHKAQYRWKARNNINGLIYGNGGLSSWTKEYVMNMKTHEASDGNDTHTVDFCLDYNNGLYWAMNDCYSTTYPNYTPFQAWRAGFREGVKMCLVNGKKPTIEEFKKIPSRNLDNLTIWHNIGSDVENGLWAIYGARLGTYTTMLTDWDHREVLDFDYLQKKWDAYQNLEIPVSLKSNIESIGHDLSTKLNLPDNVLGSEESKFFKRHYNKDKHNMGALVKEIDVIRQIEGW